MEYKSVKGFTGWAQLGFLFAFLGAGFILAGFAQFLMLPPGITLDSGEEAIKKAMFAPENIGLARASQVTGSLLLLFVPAVLWSVVSNGKNLFWLGFNKYFNYRQILIAFFIIMAASLAAAPLGDLTKNIVAHFPSLDATAKKMEALYNEQVVALSNLKSWPEYLTAIIIMAFCPALFEEVFFRGAVQILLEKWWKKPLLAIFVSAFIFSLIHMSIYFFLTRLALGFVLGLLYHKTKNIWVNIIAHFINNAIAVTQLFYESRKSSKPDFDNLDPHMPWYVGVLGVAVLVWLFTLLRKASVKDRAIIEAEENALLDKEDPFRSFANNVN